MPEEFGSAGRATDTIDGLTVKNPISRYGAAGEIRQSFDTFARLSYVFGVLGQASLRRCTGVRPHHHLESKLRGTPWMTEMEGFEGP